MGRELVRNVAENRGGDQDLLVVPHCRREAAAAMEYDGVLPETLVILVEA